MTVNLPSTLSPDFAATLTQAATALQAQISNLEGRNPEKSRPTPKALVNALLHAEKATRQQRQTYPLELLFGHWRLCFTTSPKVHLRQDVVLGKSGFYLPQFAPAQISFQPLASPLEDPFGIEIGNQVQFGPLLFRLTGPARYQTQKNLLAFDFTQMQLSLFNKTIYRGAFRKGRQAADFYNQPISKLPFFAFFLMTEHFIAARGRGGGLALWVRDH